MVISKPAQATPAASAALLGASPVMQEVLRLIERAASADCPVLLTGEPGSGRELAARAIHGRSTRHARPFIAFDCGAKPADLLEKELFGCESGPPGIARSVHTGVLERVHGGTLFLNEVTALPEGLQTRLLRALEIRRYHRVGGAEERFADVRMIAALHGGGLREDLHYRLAVFPIGIPALRERGGDVALLAAHFLAKLNAREGTRKRFSARASVVLETHAWPGNVRELKACVERAFILADHSLELEPLAPPPAQGDGESRLQIRVGSRLHDVERSLIEATLEHFRGNKRRAADALGCSLKTLYNKLNGYARGPAGGRGAPSLL